MNTVICRKMAFCQPTTRNKLVVFIIFRIIQLTLWKRKYSIRVKITRKQILLAWNDSTRTAISCESRVVGCLPFCCAVTTLFFNWICTLRISFFLLFLFQKVIHSFFAFCNGTFVCMWKTTFVCRFSMPPFIHLHLLPFILFVWVVFVQLPMADQRLPF